MSLSVLEKFLTLRSALSDINIATPDLFLVNVYIVFLSLSFYFQPTCTVIFNVTAYSWVIFKIQVINFCLLIVVFRPFTFNLVINILGC